METKSYLMAISEFSARDAWCAHVDSDCALCAALPEDYCPAGAAALDAYVEALRSERAILALRPATAGYGGGE